MVCADWDAWPLPGWLLPGWPEDDDRMALARTWAACCWGLPLASVIPEGVTCWVSWLSRLRLLPAVSANLVVSATWPVTDAPASPSAVVMPFTTPAGAPGAVMMTARFP